ncbi:conserved hypothetical protein [Mesorhizobium sp. SOD10]|nr:conserved hypothetical protein [Mesorhizobium sp. SOD10]
MVVAERLLPIDLPLLSAGAPLPHVFADEERLLIAYLVNSPDPSFDGTNPRSVSATSEGETVAILAVAPYVALQFGPPNDEALSGHRLYNLVCDHIPRSKSSIRRGLLPWKKPTGFTRAT